MGSKTCRLAKRWEAQPMTNTIRTCSRLNRSSLVINLALILLQKEGAILRNGEKNWVSPVT